ncbi:uncharacterized protein [Lolium perenne]|uniref:uncharacterized protein n=1 Tax=Lolium perenne TaxID=4522 RepID=UPI0021F59121|nr:uncharacterized protein LOC127347516 [Lolium perenne]
MNVLYTNTASRVEAWLTSIESTLDASERKIVGIDVEYDRLRGSSINPKKAAVIQLCVGTEVLVYHVCHADERSEKLYNFLYGYRYTFAGICTAEDRNVLGRSQFYIHNIKDIQMIWRDPDNKKRTQGLKDVAAAIIDPFYMKMKDGFGREEHSMWANAPPLPPEHILYAARDAYVTYEVYKREVTVIKKAKLFAADGKLSLVAGIPIVFPDVTVRIRTEAEAKKSSSTSGNHF